MTRFSLIVPTLQRTAEVERLLASLERQTFRDFEVILVDQNDDECLAPLLDLYIQRMPLQRLRMQTRGAARARNAGLPAACGEIILWPDDDSWLPSGLLAALNASFERRPQASALAGILIDETGQPHSRWTPPAPRPLGLMAAFTLAAEPVIFFRRAALESLGGFDPLIGTGAQTPWGAGEATDLCLRALRAGLRIEIDPDLRICHALAPLNLAKARAYARGMGRVLAKNRLPLPFAAAYLFTYPRAVLWNTLRGRPAAARYHLARLAGVLEGLLAKG